MFEKLDGTNLHWYWNRAFGWHAFGTRPADPKRVVLFGV
jgi:hypothetical protein